MVLSSRDQMCLNMIEQQIRPWNVLNQRVLNVFKEVYRDDFVVDDHKDIAFSEVRLPLDEQTQMLFPALEGRILQEVAIESSDNVLIVGTGSGYLTALAAKLAAEVTAVDINASFNNLAQKRCEAVGISNVKFVTADIQDFNIDKNGYDVVILTGSLLKVPPELLESLKVGGRLLAFIGIHDETTSSGILFQNQLGEIRRDSLFEYSLERLKGFEDKPQFEF